MGQWHRHWRVYALGVLLCLLAAVFSMEAKFGWYSSNGHVRVEFSSTKLQAAEASRHVSQALTAPAPVPHFPLEVPLFLSVAAVAPVLFSFRRSAIPPAPTWLSFLRASFYRPPPVHC